MQYPCQTPKPNQSIRRLINQSQLDGKIKQIMPGTWGDNQMNAEPVNVIGEFTGLVSNDMMSDEVAYNIAKAFWETKDDLATIAPFAASFAIEDATFGIINAVHPGSAKYLEEQGVAVPE